jgi:predicted TIM-barrel fold metal-dependent hydrolase
MAEKTPDVGHLLHVLSQWLDDAALQQRILVDNPALLYGFASV